MNLKVMMIDPWAVNNLSMYTNGLSAGLSQYVDLDLYTNYYYQKSTDANYRIRGIFFKKSDRMNSGFMRNIIRGLEYLSAYRKIISDLKSKQYDIMHIQWLLLRPADLLLLKIIKRFCPKLVLTAHNVMPNRIEKQNLAYLRKVYEQVDLIVLHGFALKKDFEALFPDLSYKTKVQMHGIYLNQKTAYNPDKIDSTVKAVISKFKRIYLYIGFLFYNKGVDRLVKIWLEDFKHNNQELLIIAGKDNSHYRELNELNTVIDQCDNILYLNYYVEEELLNYMMNQADLVLLPSRNASMSGTVFTAAGFAKPLLATSVGVISEYLIDGVNSFIVANDEQEFRKKLSEISSNYDKKTLQTLGENLKRHVDENYTWDIISEKLFREVYLHEHIRNVS